MSWSDLFDSKSIIANMVGTVLATLFTGISSVIVLKPLRSWLFKQDPYFRNSVLKITDFLKKPYLRLFIFTGSAIALYLNLPYKIVFLILALSIFMSFFDSEEKKQAVSRKSSQFSDDFNNGRIDLEKWVIKTGNPDFYNEMGHLCLNLKMAKPSISTNSFLLAKNCEAKKGSISCDIYMPPESVFNIIFFCDNEKENWHMARFDSRKTEYNGFLIKDNDNWRINVNSAYRTEDMQWHSVRVDFDSEKARMYKDGDFLVEIKNPPVFGKKIGFFNEVKDVLIRNFVYSYQ